MAIDNSFVDLESLRITTDTPVGFELTGVKKKGTHPADGVSAVGTL